MREIEIKARVESLDTIREALKQRSVAVSVAVHHRDVVWGIAGELSATGAPWLRLRAETKDGSTRYLFTLKRSAEAGRQLDSIEHETEVSDPKAVEGIVRELGFVQYSDITKTRQKAQSGDIEICLDTVDGLGEFIEAEILTNEAADFQQITDELWTLLERLGASREDEVEDGYDVLVNKKLGKEWV